MYKKIVLAIGGIAIIASLMLPPVTTEVVILDPNAGFSWERETTITKTDYNSMATRTISILVAFGVLYAIVPSSKKKEE